MVANQPRYRGTQPVEIPMYRSGLDDAVRADLDEVVRPEYRELVHRVFEPVGVAVRPSVRGD